MSGKKATQASQDATGRIQPWQGPQGEPGKDSVVTLEEVEKLILDLLGSAAVRDEVFVQFAKTKREITRIEGDHRYQRVDPHRREIVARLRGVYQPED